MIRRFLLRWFGIRPGIPDVMPGHTAARRLHGNAPVKSLLVAK